MSIATAEPTARPVSTSHEAVVRHDAGYELAIAAAKKFGLKRPMVS